MRIAVTGAAGFVGAAVVRSLLEHGCEVVAVTRGGGGLGRLLPVLGAVELVETDFERPENAARAVAATTPDACIHLAAAGAVVRDPDLDRVVRVNALAPLALARALPQGRLVVAGSSSEYGPAAGPMNECDAALPDGAYGAAKLSGWVLARAAALERGLECVNLRLFSVYGPGEDERRLVPSVARALVERRPVDLTPGGQVRDFVFVEDAAEALVLAALAPTLDGVVLNVGTGRQTTVREACLLLAEAASAEPELLRFGALPYRPGERFSWQADTSLTADVLGWRAGTDLREGLARTVRSLAVAA